MINYADYEFYKNVYKGSLSNDLFSLYIIEASREIDRNVNRTITDGYISKMSNEDKYKLQYVACALCDFYSNNGTSTSGQKNVSIDGVSISGGGDTLDTIAKAKKNVLGNLPHELTRFL